ncbi:hypothetical protein [Arthrobacter sp. H5]|uniref:hypothetical protein n=1 Tax=Arthrobacter sp. H5 TaxID=1267973 RepID=UPI000482873A|nr:hypothetical protein [Arthrobacter sp. H5]
MKNGVGHLIVGGALIILSTFFVPQGISGFATAAAREEPVQSGAGVLLAIGAVMVVAAIVLLARGHFLRNRNRISVATYDTREDEDITSSRPGYFKDRPAWFDHPTNHMGKNYGQKRD